MQFPHAGQTFQAKYKLIEVLGRGGFAAVYKAVDIEIGREVAIKILVPTEDGYDSGLVARFLREARVVAQLRDPHTITMFDFGRSDDGLLFMVFEYVAGADLAHVLTERGPLEPRVAVHILRQLLYALREAHSAGVLHRDIKPANVLVYSYMDDPFRVKLLDFGIAKPGVGKNSDPVATLTKTGGIIGTPRYMSPEQLCGEELGETTDIYSLGLVAYEMLVGAPAIDGRDTRDNLRLQLSEQPLMLPFGAPVPPQLRAYVERMMAREASERFQSTREALDALADFERHATSGPQQHRPSSTSQRVSSVNIPPRVATTTRLGSIEGLGTRARQLSTPMLVAIGAVVGGAIVVPLMMLSKQDHSEPVARPAPTRVSNELVRGSEPDRPAAAGTSQTTAAPAVVEEPEQLDGCGKPAEPGEERLTRTFGLQPRSWIRYVPKSYDPDKPAPVLLLLHDRTRSGRKIIDDTQFGPIADEHGFIIIAPNGSDYTQPWRPESDLDMVLGIINDTSQALCIDRSRIFGVGHNLGAGALEELACLMPFSAIATTAFRGDGSVPCKYQPPVPHIHLVGADNRYMPIEGGPTCTGSNVKPLADKEDAWYRANGCTGDRRNYETRPDGVCSTKTCTGAAFVSCVPDGGRDWPHGSARDLELPSCSIRAGDFPFAATIWEFFAKHGRALEEIPE